MTAIFGMKRCGKVPHRLEDVEGLSRKNLVVQVIGKQAFGNPLYRNPWKRIYKRRGTQGIGSSLFFALQVQHHR
jgi:hypothetical protein